MWASIIEQLFYRTEEVFGFLEYKNLSPVNTSSSGEAFSHTLFGNLHPFYKT